jgi:nucleoside-diphosphate kinase
MIYNIAVFLHIKYEKCPQAPTACCLPELGAVYFNIRTYSPAFQRKLFFMERTFVMLKPGVLQRRIAGEILSRFERKGFKITACKMLKMNRTQIETHYAEHKGKDFYEKLVEYTLSGPVLALVLEGENAIALVRRLCGPTDIHESLPGTIRGDYAYRTRLNIVHASDSPAGAEREIALFFTPAEICVWPDGNQEWF